MAPEKAQLSEKAVRYIDALSQAQCEGKWSEVPELARKVEKHSARKCLAQAARVQAAQEQHISSKGSGSPSVPIEPLLAAIADLTGTKEDQYQAHVCAQWLYWINGEYQQAISAIPSSAIPSTNTEKEGERMGWTYVCIVKSAYIRGACYEAINKRTEAVTTYTEAAARVLEPSTVPVKETPQYRFWVEMLLNRCCRISEPTAESTAASADQLTDTLEVFRAWSKASLPDMVQSGFASGGLSLEEKLTRRTTWLSYYRLLSSLVARLSGPSGHLSLPVGDVVIPSKLDLCLEVQHVQATYERLLLKEVGFPRANEYNVEVDDWVTQAMLNWAALTGSAWSNADIPRPGKRALSQGMLEILYRATTRSFHSMNILRSLSIVHTSLGEFDLAARALDSYVTTVTKAKARIQKSGEDEPGVDSDDTMVKAISAGMEMLCTFGGRKEASRAHELSLLLGRLINENEHPLSPKSPTQAEQDQSTMHFDHVSISVRTRSIAQQAIGIANARWAQLTYDPQIRSHMQAASLKYLRKSLQGGPTNESDLKALFALGLACAENRDIPGALAAIKEALLQTLPSDDSGIQSKRSQGGKLSELSSASARCWHLLTLLLTSRQDFENAAASCDEALEQLKEPLLSEAHTQMSIADKQSLISLQISRIAIRQVLEGTEAAINDSTNLFSLHGELFPERSKISPRTTKPATTSMPPSAGSGGKTFSIRGSILGKPKANRSSQNIQTDSAKHGNPASEVLAKPSLAPSVPEEPTRPATSYSQKSVSRSASKRLQKQPSKKTVTKPSKQQPSTENGATKLTVENVNKGAAANEAPQLGPKLSQDGEESLPSGENANLGQILPISSINTFVPCSMVRYSEIEHNRRSNETLAQVWLFTSALYRQAGLYQDSTESLHEAIDLVREIEGDVARSGTSSAEEFEKPGWGNSASVEELWANVYTERGELRRAQSRPLAALAEFENALAHFPDHAPATVGLSNVLLDIYAGKVTVPTRESMRQKSTTDSSEEPIGAAPILATVHKDPAANENQDKVLQSNGVDRSTAEEDSTEDMEASSDSQSPESLDRLAARDRAYNLLSTLSKLGSGWDRSEVWFALSRAYEESGQLDKAQEALWWVVELEKKKPIRHWETVGQGYSLSF